MKKYDRKIKSMMKKAFTLLLAIMLFVGVLPTSTLVVFAEDATVTRNTSYDTYYSFTMNNWGDSASNVLYAECDDPVAGTMDLVSYVTFNINGTGIDLSKITYMNFSINQLPGGTEARTVTLAILDTDVTSQTGTPEQPSSDDDHRIDGWVCSATGTQTIGFYTADDPGLAATLSNTLADGVVTFALYSKDGQASFSSKASGSIAGLRIDYDATTLASVTTNNPTNITTTSATLNGTVTDDGGDANVTRGFNVTGNVAGSGEGAFSAPYSSLIPNTQYTYNAYADNTKGRATGGNVSFWTLAAAPGLSGAYPQANGSVDLSINENGNSNGTYYYVQMDTNAGFTGPSEALDWTNPAGNTLTIPKAKMTPGTAYYFRVMARNGAGTTTAYSNSASIPMRVSDAPNAPAVTVDSPTQISLSWNAPTSATAYDVYENGIKVIPDTASTSAVRTALTPNTSYSYTVVAKNAAGASVASTATAKYTLAVIPDLTAISPDQNGTVTLTIDKKNNPNATQYYIEKSINEDFTGTTQAMNWSSLGVGVNTVNINGLTGDTVYYFRIKARNGNSVETTYGTTQSALTVPPVPAKPAAVPASDTSMTISWAKVACVDTAQADILYDLYQGGVLVEASIQVADPENPSYTHTGLTPNTSYTYTVKSRNASGASLASAASDAKYTAASIPDIDTVTALSNGNVKLIVEEYGNPGYTKYYVEKSTTPTFTGGTTSEGLNWSNPDNTHELTITGLNRGTLYYFRVKAINENSVQTAYGNIITSVRTIPGDVLQAPAVAAVSTSQINITWDPVAGATSYDLYKNGVFFKNVTGTSATDTGLAPNTGNIYKVTGKSSSGYSINFSPNSAIKYSWPSVPQLTLVPDQTGTSIVVTIITNNNSAGTQYELEYSTHSDFSGATASAWSTNTSRTLNGLASGTTYYFRVKARNGNNGANTDKESAWASTLQTETALSMVGNTLTASAQSDAQIDLSWNAVANAESYKIYRNSVLAGTSMTNTFSDTGLHANAGYSYTVTAVNSAGIESLPSTATAARTLAAYPASISITDKTASAVILELTPSSNVEDSQSYQLIVKKKSDQSVARTLSWSSDLIYTVEGLDNATEYELWVAVRNNDRTPQPSKKMIDSFYTNRDPQASISFSDAEINYFRSEADGHNYFVISGKAWDADGQPITVKATIDGILRTKAIANAPTSEPAADNFTLTWDAWSLSQGTYNAISLTITDNSDGSGTAAYARTLVIDKTKPVITLDGAPKESHIFYIPLGGNYTEPVAAATDNQIHDSGVDGTVTVSGSVNTGIAGVYAVTYSAIDVAGNTKTITRSVHVYAPEAVGKTQFSNRTKTSVTLSSEILSTGSEGGLNKEYGFVYSINPVPDLGDGDTTTVFLSNPSTGAYSMDITGLTADTSYYVRSYIEVDGTATYGEETIVKTAKASLLPLEERKKIQETLDGIPESEEKEDLIDDLKAKSPSKEDYEYEVTVITTVDDLRKLLEDVNANKSLDEGDKASILSKVVDKALEEPSSIVLESAEDVDILKKAIEDSAKTPEEKRSAVEALAEKALADLTDGGRKLSKEESDSIAALISTLPEGGTKTSLTNALAAAVYTKTDIANEIEAAADMADVRELADRIKHSTLSDADKKELNSSLAQHALDDASGIDIEKAADVKLISDMIDNSDMTEAEKSAARQKLEVKAEAAIAAEINTLTTMEQVRKMAQDIADTTALTDAKKKELLMLLAEHALETASIVIETAADVELLHNAIINSESTDPEKQAALEDLAEKAIADLSKDGREMSDEERTKVVSVIDDIDDPVVRAQLTDDIPDPKTKVDLENQIAAVVTMEDVKRAYEDIKNSSLTDEEKRELIGDLADKVIDPPGIAVTTAEEYALVKNLIEESDKTDGEKESSLEALTAKSITEMAIVPSETAKFAIEYPAYDVNEDAGTVQIKVIRSVVTAGIMTVDYTTENGSAAAGVNYTATSGTLTFANGVTEQTVTLSISEAGITENKAFKLKLSNVSNGASITRNAAIINILSLPAAPSANKQITGFTLAGVAATITHNADAADGTIELTVPYGTAISNIAPSVLTCSPRASVAPSSATLRNFEDSVVYTVTAENGTTKRYVVTVDEAAASTDATLSSLGLGGVAFTPGFAPGHVYYDVSVSAGTTELTLNPVMNDANATLVIKKNGNVVTSPVSLSAGTNTITIEVTAQDGVTVKTYTIAVEKPIPANPSNNANLSQLVVRMGGAAQNLTPGFSTNKFSGYTLDVPNTASEVTIDPTVAQGNASCEIFVNGAAATNPVALNVGQNTIVIQVTAEDGVNIKEYTLTITRAASESSSDNTLSAITLSSGTLSPGFNANTTRYNVNVGNTDSQMSIQATLNNPAADKKLFVNGVEKTFGASFALNVGSNAVNIVVTAVDGTQKEYFIAVSRAEAAASGGGGGGFGGGGSGGGGGGGALPGIPGNPGTIGTSPLDTPTNSSNPFIIAPSTSKDTVNKNNEKTTVVTVDDQKVEQGLGTAGQKPTLLIPVHSGSSIVTSELNGQTVKLLGAKEATIEIRTDNAGYLIPASMINIDKVSEQIGSKVELKDIKVSITISDSSKDEQNQVFAYARKNGYLVVAKPVKFEITCTAQDKRVEVNKFTGYVERTIVIPEGVDATKITTGVLLNADGSFTHVPTVITYKDGRYYARISSLSNSAYSVIYSPKEFTDMKGHWAEESVNDMGSRLIISGTGNGKFEPDRDITRAEFAVIVVRALGLMRPGTGKAYFSDVPKSAGYFDAVSIAYENGIISGYGNGKFGPDDKITREQAVTMIAKAMKITGLKAELTGAEVNSILAQFKDGNQAVDYSKNSLAACLKLGIVTTRTGNAIAPKERITRAEVAVFIRNLLLKSKLI